MFGDDAEKVVARYRWADSNVYSWNEGLHDAARNGQEQQIMDGSVPLANHC
jgi:hypothetical protein